MDRAAFLGPKAENVDELERLLLEVLHDHAFWRRNFHPADPRLITEADKRTEAYSQSAARLRDELFQILAELKRGAPLFSPRQIGHMVTDPSLPALVGYFAGLLYNQNNVVAEAAPETVRKEREYMDALSRMVGYPPMLPERLPARAQLERTAFSWGHLASGGTLANIEALWVARNVKLYPLALRLLAHEHPSFGTLGDLPVRGVADHLADLKTFELLNLPLPAVTELHLSVRQLIGEGGSDTAAEFERRLSSVRKVGLATLLTRYNDAFPGDRMRPPIAFVSRAAHYGWGKGMDVAGLGAASLREVDVDEHLRLDVDVLEDVILREAAAEQSVLMVIGILGTTEEGSVDPLHRIAALRDRLEAGGISFWHHADAAFGGYLASAIPRDETGAALPLEAAAEDLLDPEVYRAVAALARTDSITIDPHKWGFVPYPGGAVLFRDYNVRDAIAYAAPYLPMAEVEGFGGFLGRWTLEGSRPGAPAVSAYLAQAVMPLEPSGHGRLVRNAIGAARSLLEALRSRFDSGPLEVRLLAEPDTVGFCFVLAPRDVRLSVAEQNRFTRRLWERVNVDGREDIGSYSFILSKTEILCHEYPDAIQRMMPRLLPAGLDESLMLLRVFVLNPLVEEWNRKGPGFADLFATHLAEVAEDIYPEIALRRVVARDGSRMRLLVAMDPDRSDCALCEAIDRRPGLAAFLEIDCVPAEPHRLAEAIRSVQPHRVIIPFDLSDRLRSDVVECVESLQLRERLIVVQPEGMSSLGPAPAGALILEWRNDAGDLSRLVSALSVESTPAIPGN